MQTDTQTVNLTDEARQHLIETVRHSPRWGERKKSDTTLMGNAASSILNLIHSIENEDYRNEYSRHELTDEQIAARARHAKLKMQMITATSFAEVAEIYDEMDDPTAWQHPHHRLFSYDYIHGVRLLREFLGNYPHKGLIQGKNGGWKVTTKKDISTYNRESIEIRNGSTYSYEVSWSNETRYAVRTEDNRSVKPLWMKDLLDLDWGSEDNYLVWVHLNSNRDYLHESTRKANKVTEMQQILNDWDNPEWVADYVARQKGYAQSALDKAQAEFDSVDAAYSKIRDQVEVV
jgi:hypothetical protein